MIYVPKNKAADWTLKKLPEGLKSLMIMAIQGYLGECVGSWNDKEKEVNQLIHFLKRKIENY